MSNDTPTEAPSPDAYPFIYKILRMSEWSIMKAMGEFIGSVDDKRDGYIHLSTAEHVKSTLDKYYTTAVTRGQAVILVKIKTDGLEDKLKYELARGDIFFPHYYAPLPMSHVVDDVRLSAGSDGLYDPTEFLAKDGA